MSSTNAEQIPANHNNSALEVRQFCATNQLDLGATWLAACSGGCDSTALAYLLHELLCEHRGTLHLAYLDHALRGAAEAEAERSAVEKISLSLGVSLHVEQLQPGQLRIDAARRGIGLEAAARDVRYRFLHRTALRSGARYLATGHHADDQAETVLMRLMRGSGPRGLAGIPALRPVCDDSGALCYTVVRPVVNLPCAALRRFCIDRGVEWVEDRTNDAADYQRNVVRHSIMPTLYAFDREVSERISRSAVKIGESQQALEALAHRLVVWHLDNGELSTAAAGFFAQPAALRRVALYQALELMRTRGICRETPSVPARFFEPLAAAELPLHPADAAAMALRGHGVQVWLDDNRVCVAADVVRYSKKGYLVSCAVQAAGGVTSSVVVECGSSSVILRTSDLLPPVLVRSRRPGDAIELQVGHKSLKKVFNEYELRQDCRSAVAVVEDAAGVVAVLVPDRKTASLLRIGIQPLDRPTAAVTRVEWRGDRFFE
ncbi:MAG: tRNA lysidine(34) synthetase TilS [Spirochaetaceae bacterium]|nr:MAG: tRNA lysidine(34) synthetase TilS [Spirochaetaceae bacterium]